MGSASCRRKSPGAICPVLTGALTDHYFTIRSMTDVMTKDKLTPNVDPEEEERGEREFPAGQLSFNARLLPRLRANAHSRK